MGQKTLVIGLGNPILTDDGVGVKVAYAVDKALTSEIRNDITVTEASVGGLGLMEMMLNYNRVILIDALISETGKPGTIRRMKLDDLQAVSPTQHSASAHDTSLDTALVMGQRMGLPLPGEIIIYAIEVENILEFGEKPTLAVEQAIPKVSAAVLAELGYNPELQEKQLYC
jgi:hydrogenase maturation protease